MGAHPRERDRDGPGPRTRVACSTMPRSLRRGAVLRLSVVIAAGPAGCAPPVETADSSAADAVSGEQVFDAAIRDASGETELDARPVDDVSSDEVSAPDGLFDAQRADV